MVSDQPPHPHRPVAMKPDDSDEPTGALIETLKLDGIDRPASRAYQGIRRAILSGTLPGGSHLREEALARMLGISRTPIREALHRLIGEGLVRDEGRSRFVAEFPYDEVVIVFDIRARLESYAARVAAERVVDAELDELARIIDAIDDLSREGPKDDTIQRFAELNTRFHSTILTATRSPQMKILSAQAKSIPLELIKQFVWSQKVNIERSNLQHREILAALTNRNPAWAEAAMSGHILSTRPVRQDESGPQSKPRKGSTE